jgi:hypothetical protein
MCALLGRGETEEGENLKAPTVHQGPVQVTNVASLWRPYHNSLDFQGRIRYISLCQLPLEIQAPSSVLDLRMLGASKKGLPI